MVDERGGRRKGLRWRFHASIALGVLTIAVAVVAVVQTQHFSSSSSPKDGLGFFKPESTKPVSFTLPSLTSPSSQKTSFDRLLGKPLVLNLWASTCTVCRSETPAIEHVARQLGAQVTFVGIDTLDTRSAGIGFVRKYGVTYRQLFDGNGVVASGYAVPGLPITLFLSAKGKVVGENIGAMTATSLRHDVNVLFGLPATSSAGAAVASVRSATGEFEMSAGYRPQTHRAVSARGPTPGAKLHV